MNRKCSFENLLCGKSEAEGGKEVTQVLLTGRRLVSIPLQRNADKVSEPARKLKLQEMTHFFPPQILISKPRYNPCMSLMPIQTLSATQKKMLSGFCLHPHGH